MNEAYFRDNEIHSADKHQRNTPVETIEQIQDVNLDAEDIQDNICTGICIGVIVSKKDSCLICNHTIEELPEKENCYNCANCHNTHTENSKEDQTGVYLNNANWRYQAHYIHLLQWCCKKLPNNHQYKGDDDMDR